ncbi:MAG: hypothetical protein CM15mP59_2440 [Flavobacteriaceae bacterium]|nr:MAG: hypothetical protein CM15mP59_2440 [Flavobacteriaceae bacterium]
MVTKFFQKPQSSITKQIGCGEELPNKQVSRSFMTLEVKMCVRRARSSPSFRWEMPFFSSYDACLNLGGFANVSLPCKKIELLMI